LDVLIAIIGIVFSIILAFSKARRR
jgi:hypothetical protein